MSGRWTLPATVIPAEYHYSLPIVKPVAGWHEIPYRGASLKFHLRRSHRRTLAITVQPDLTVRVVAPQRAKLELVKEKLRKRGAWVRKQQRFFAEFQPKLPPPQYVSGETHRYLGRQYRLKVVECDKNRVSLKGRFIWVHTRRKSDTRTIRKLVNSWYLARAKDRFLRSLDEGVARLGKRLRTRPPMRVRRMSKRWGSWTCRSGISLNPELIKAPPMCIDYVIIHELCHAIHDNHSKSFYHLLQRMIADWKERKMRLERLTSA